MGLKLLDFLAVILICLVAVPVYAQSNFKDGEYTVNKNEYIVTSIKNSKSKLISIQQNSEFIEKLLNDKRGFANIDGFRFSNGKTIESAFVDVFSKERIVELLPEKEIRVFIYPDYKGGIAAVDIVVSSDSKITMEEFDGFIVYLKKHVSVVFPLKIDPNFNITSILQVIRFKTVLEKGSTF